jgi:signal transduction histidine kinase
MAVSSSARMAELGTLSAGIAHEINNPLAIISGNVSMLEKNLKSSDPNIPLLLRYSGQIANSMRRISQIIQGLKSFSRDGSKDPFEAHSVARILDEILPICQASLSSKGVQLDVEVEGGSIQLNCRPIQIVQILMNLLNNAADAVSELEERWVRLHIYQDLQSQVVFTITDSGSGIPEEIRKKIFVPFFTTKPIGSGTGLGLAIVHGIVRQHHGSIEINPESKNTQFILRFPKYEVQNVA